MKDSSINSELEVLIADLSESVKSLCEFYEQPKEFGKLVSTQWTAKDVLGHLTFWHESFARNVKDLALDIPPTPLKGKLSEVNQSSVETTATNSIKELLVRLNKAQATIEEHIVSDLIEMIPYKKGSRDYSRQEHLEIVSNHIQKHLKQLIKAYRHD